MTRTTGVQLEGPHSSTSLNCTLWGQVHFIANCHRLMPCIINNSHTLRREAPSSLYSLLPRMAMELSPTAGEAKGSAPLFEQLGKALEVEGPSLVAKVKVRR